MGVLVEEDGGFGSWWRTPAMGVLVEEDCSEEMRQLRVAAVRGMRCRDLVPWDSGAEELTEICHPHCADNMEMECSVGEEQWLISSGGHRKYGSTAIHNNKPERLIRYDVQEDDTLQGIALKYNVTMEQLKRANKLWTNDNLHVRRTLLIPLPLEESPGGQLSDRQSSDSDDGRSSAAASSHAEEAETPSQSAADFLQQIDSVIARSRREVKRLQLG